MKYFQLYELVDKRTYEKLGDAAWGFFNPEALTALDDIREFFNSPVTVNNWYSGGPFQWRGYRTPEQAAREGSPNSQHRFGNAFDLDIQGVSAEEARQTIIANKNSPQLKRIQRLEGKVNWVHFDLKPVPNRIYVFSA